MIRELFGPKAEKRNSQRGPPRLCAGPPKEVNVPQRTGVLRVSFCRLVEKTGRYTFAQSARLFLYDARETVGAAASRGGIAPPFKKRNKFGRPTMHNSTYQQVIVVVLAFQHSSVNLFIPYAKRNRSDSGADTPSVGEIIRT